MTHSKNDRQQNPADIVTFHIKTTLYFTGPYFSCSATCRNTIQHPINLYIQFIHVWGTQACFLASKNWPWCPFFWLGQNSIQLDNKTFLPCWDGRNGDGTHMTQRHDSLKEWSPTNTSKYFNFLSSQVKILTGILTWRDPLHTYGYTRGQHGNKILYLY